MVFLPVIITEIGGNSQPALSNYNHEQVVYIPYTYFELE